jgi:hypothetical protein
MNRGENVSFDTVITFSTHILQSRQLPTTSSSPSPFAASIRNISSLWPVRGGHTQPRIVDVPLAQAKEVCSIDFHYRLISCIIFSGTPQQVLPKKTRI